MFRDKNQTNVFALLRLILLASIVFTFCVANSATYAANWKVIYSEDFSSDPSWTTDQPTNFYWESSTGTYFLHETNAPGTPDPNRYTYKIITPYSGGPFRLEWDIEMLRVDWSAGIEFGMFSSLMACLPTAGSARVGADWGRSDGGRAIAPYTHQDLNGTSNGSYAPQYDLDVWYHNVLEYDPETQTINLTVYVRGESIPFMVITLANVPIITSDIYYLGSARYPVGNPPYDAGLSLSAIAEARIDNVVLSVEDPFCKSDSNYDGKVNLSDLVMIKSEFNRSDCPSDGPAPVERTWQTTSYANYDDGCYQK